MRTALQGLVVVLVFALVLVADGLMDLWGPLGFVAIASAVLAVCGLLLYLSDRPRGKRKPSAGDSSSNGRQHRRKHQYITPPIMEDEKGFVKDEKL